MGSYIIVGAGCFFMGTMIGIIITALMVAAGANDPAKSGN